MRDYVFCLCTEHISGVARVFENRPNADAHELTQLNHKTAAMNVLLHVIQYSTTHEDACTYKIELHLKQFEWYTQFNLLQFNQRIHELSHYQLPVVYSDDVDVQADSVVSSHALAADVE